MPVNKEKGTMTEHKEQYWSKFACTYSDDQNYVVGKKILQLINRFKPLPLVVV